MADFLLDSDVIIWLFRGRDETLQMVHQLRSQTQNPIACSAMSVLEIWMGVRRGEESRTQVLLESFHVLPVSGDIARRAASLLSSRRLEKNTGDWIDAVIAGTCLEHRLTLVTYNRRDYPYHGISLHPVQ